MGDVNQIAEKDGSYDAIVAFGTLSNIDDARQSLREFHRLLTPGGVVVASVTNDNIARRILVFLSGIGKPRTHFSMVAYKRNEWESLLSDAGFEKVESYPIVTRLPLYTYFPFLRKSSADNFDWKSARDGDRGIQLNSLGELIFEFCFKHIPFTISHGVVGVAKKQD